MGSEVTFIIGGREVSPENLGDALKAQVWRSVSDSVAERLRSIRCPEHGSVPVVVAEGSSLDTLEWKISGCCEKLRDEAQKALKRP